LPFFFLTEVLGRGELLLEDTEAADECELTFDDEAGLEIVSPSPIAGLLLSSIVPSSIVWSNVGAVVMIEGGVLTSGTGGGSAACARALTPKAGSDAVRNRNIENRLFRFASVLDLLGGFDVLGRSSGVMGLGMSVENEPVFSGVASWITFLSKAPTSALCRRLSDLSRLAFFRDHESPVIVW